MQKKVASPYRGGATDTIEGMYYYGDSHMSLQYAEYS